jgi:hypothetical protein
MIEPTNIWAERAAELALTRAQEACVAAQLDPNLHEELLASFVIEEVRIAVAEMAHCKAHGGPTPPPSCSPNLSIKEFSLRTQVDGQLAPS